MPNSIVLISDTENASEFIQKRLTLLREQDSITCLPPTLGLKSSQANPPHVIIIPVEDNEAQALEILKEYKNDEVVKNVPILIFAKKRNRAFFTSAYELGADEILFHDIPDYEFFIRLIWLIQKGEDKKTDLKFSKFLESFEIINKETGLLEEKHSEKFLMNEIDAIKNSDKETSLLLLEPKDTERDFSLLIKKSIRKFDVLIKIENKYFLLLSGTDQKNVKKLFSRLCSDFRLEGGVRAVVGDIKKFGYEEIKEKMFETIDKIDENILVSLSKTNLEPIAMTSKEIEERENKLKKIKIAKKIKKETTQIVEPKPQEAESVEETKEAIEEEIKETPKKDIKKEKINKIKALKKLKKTPEQMVKVLENKIEESVKTKEILSESEILKRSTRLHKLKEIAKENKPDTLFEQTYKRKTDLIIAPQFVKYRDWAEKNIERVVTDIVIASDKAKFMLAKDETTMLLEMKPVESSVLVDIKSKIGDVKPKVKHGKVEILELDNVRMNKLMAIFMREVEKNIKNV